MRSLLPLLACGLLFITIIPSGVEALRPLPPPEKSSKVLMLLPASSKSHRNIFMPIANALADRGHKITMLVNHPPASKHPNIKEIHHGLTHFNEDTLDFFAQREDSSGQLSTMTTAFASIARDIYKVPAVKELYERRHEFDVVLVSYIFNEAVYPFLHEMPFIYLQHGGHHSVLSAQQGNVLNPSYMPHALLHKTPPFSFIDRVKSTFANVMLPLVYNIFYIVPTVQKEITPQFPDIPSIMEIAANSSLSLISSHPAINVAAPLLPNQVEVACLHCVPGKALPKPIKEWIDGASKSGVIYFSLGTVVNPDNMPKKYLDIIVEAMRRMPYRFLWKYSADVKDKPANVFIQKWMPQQDILADAGVKLFVTHGGLLSCQETIYHGMPVVGMPVFGDQPTNCLNMNAKGFGKCLIWEELTVDLLVDTLTEVIEGSSYRKTVKEISKVFRDQPESPIDRAVWWIEYVIRHRGAPHLRSPAADLTWIQYLLLDVIFVFHVIVFAVFALVYVIISKCCCSKQKSVKKKNKNKRD